LNLKNHKQRTKNSRPFYLTKSSQSEAIQDVVVNAQPFTNDFKHGGDPCARISSKILCFFSKTKTNFTNHFKPYQSVIIQNHNLPEATDIPNTLTHEELHRISLVAPPQLQLYYSTHTQKL